MLGIVGELNALVHGAVEDNGDHKTNGRNSIGLEATAAPRAKLGKTSIQRLAISAPKVAKRKAEEADIPLDDEEFNQF